MGQLLIRNVDDRVIEVFEAQGRAQGALAGTGAARDSQAGRRAHARGAPRHHRPCRGYAKEADQDAERGRRPKAETGSHQEVGEQARVIVVDANVAIKWAIVQPLRERARALLSQTLVAPGMFVAEVTSAVWQYARAGQISDQQASQGISVIIAQIATFESDADLAGDALAIGLELGVRALRLLLLGLRDAQTRTLCHR